MESKKLAIMQPYLFPYIGYFQLINAVDTFVIYDDVNFIKKGWINRNNILVNNTKFQFTFPIKSASQNTLIRDLNFNTEISNNFLKTLKLAYHKAPNFQLCNEMFSEIFYYSKTNLTEYIAHSLNIICQYLGIKTQFMISSEIEKDKSLKGEQKIIEICKKLNATHYINPIGGLELYDKSKFFDEKIKLNFIQTKGIKYQQFGDEFVPGLSIIDVIMFNSKTEISDFLLDYDLK
ncbi:MAG: WbqC family protein [Bacteroidota bacterium]